MRSKFAKTLLALVCVGYVITLVFGAPAAENEILREVLREHESFVRSAQQPIQLSPMVTIHWAVPVLPFLIVVKHDYFFASLYGAGSIDLFLWFPWSIQRLHQFNAWVA
jgi:hypothetical protein